MHDSITTSDPSGSVVIIGAGLAGLTLALQIKQTTLKTRVTVIERKSLPYPEATHKVGESTVELAANYFSEVLGLKKHLQEDQLRKLGLRLFFTAGDNQQIEKRLEMGSDKHFAVPTYQIDRGRFENYLADRATDLGVTIITNARVRDVQIASDGEPHTISYTLDETAHLLHASWVIDASGRAGLLKKQLNAQLPSEHDSSAVWFRMKGRIDIDDWVDEPAWREGHDGIYSRWYSTNHLTGSGYWVWLIPLASGYTSIGVVTDPKLHPFSQFRSFEDTLSWLEKFEPQCARHLAQRREDLADFLAIKHYAHKCSRIISGDRWAITGDAGVFIDPLYSPGSDFIAIQNTFITDVISRDVAGQRFIGRCEAYNDIYQELCESFLKTFLGQYPVFGNPRIMPLKVIWDYTIYWGFLAFVAIQRRFCDLESLGAIQEAIMKIYARGEEMQIILREGNERSVEPVPPGMLDIANIPFLVHLNRLMAKPHRPEDFLPALEANLVCVEEVFQKIKEIVESPVPLWNTAAELIALLQGIALPAPMPAHPTQQLAPVIESASEAA